MHKWWLYQINVTGKTNIVCFVVVMLISIICIMAAKKMKLPVWKFQIRWILFMDLVGVPLLISRITHVQ